MNYETRRTDAETGKPWSVVHVETGKILQSYRYSMDADAHVRRLENARIRRLRDANVRKFGGR